MRTWCIVLACFGAAGSAAAQTGVLDQSSPRAGASYNLNESFLIWQQQIRCGRAGTLEGIRLTLLGPPGATMTLQIRRGAAPSTEPVLARHEVVKQTESQEDAFVDMRSDALVLAVDDVFVMETFGNATGMNLVGSYVAPPGTPLYPEPLYLDGSIFPEGWRHGFDTFMIFGPAPCYANCDGSTTLPLLNVNDFVCFQSRFAAAEPYADCNHDNTLNVNDFVCFQAAFAAGCP